MGLGIFADPKALTRTIGLTLVSPWTPTISRIVLWHGGLGRDGWVKIGGIYMEGEVLYPGSRDRNNTGNGYSTGEQPRYHDERARYGGERTNSNFTYQAPSQVMCASCGGGNPTVAMNCMWCGQQLRTAPAAASLGTPTVRLPYPNQQGQGQQFYQGGYSSAPQPTTLSTYPQYQQYPQQPAYQPVIVQNTQTVIVARPKSVGVAILLTFLFGPLGMFYSTVGGALVMLCVSVILAVSTLGLSLPFRSLVCIIWGAAAASTSNNRAIAAHQSSTYVTPQYR